MEKTKRKIKKTDTLIRTSAELSRKPSVSTLSKNRRAEIKLDTEQMVQAGLHFGHRSSRVHPKMKPFIYGIRNGIHLIDVEKTKEKLQEALKYIREIISEGQVLLLVGTKIQMREAVKTIAKECGLPYVSERWLGGTFTNFDNLRKRVDYFKDLEKKREEGELEKYTKKERAKIDQELKDLEVKFGGIKDLVQLPQAVFILDIKEDALTVKEARAKGVKIIGLADTNTNPELLDYPIPANDDALSSVKYILEKVKEAILKAKLPAATKAKKEEKSSLPPKSKK